METKCKTENSRCSDVGIFGVLALAYIREKMLRHISICIECIVRPAQIYWHKSRAQCKCWLYRLLAVTSKISSENFLSHYAINQFAAHWKINNNFVEAKKQVHIMKNELTLQKADRIHLCRPEQ